MKIKNLFPLTLLLAGSAAFSTGDASKPLRLFQLFSDQEQKRPRSGEPYMILLNGKVANFGVTDKVGAVVTDKRIAKTSQEFVMQLFQIGTYSFRLDANDRVTNTKIGPWPDSADWENACKRDKSDCDGKGFYWLRLMGKGTDFEAEPYALTVGGQRQTGQVAKGGYIFVPQNDAPEASAPMRLQLCDGRAINVVSGWKLNDMSVTPSTAAAGPALAGCEKSGVSKYAQKYAHLNGGAPYIFTQWSKGQTPAEIAQQAANAEQDAAAGYQKIATANNDNLAWLGALPSTWSDKVYETRLDAVIGNIKKDISSESAVDPQTFQCKLPAQVGSVPDQNAVDNYLAEFPASIHNEQLLRPLYAAAAKGNWLAAAQIYGLRTQFRPEGNKQASAFRTLQLMEWLQARKIGTLYREFGYALAASGYFSGMGNRVTGIDIYAAMHGSYPAQLEVGKEFAESDKPELQAIGKKMITCAKSASPGYQRQIE